MIPDLDKKIKESEKIDREIKIKQILRLNNCTENYFPIPFSKIVYTDGIKNLIELCKCSWLITDIGILIQHKKKLQKPFLILRLEVKEDNKAIITLREDSDLKPIYTKKLDYTDFCLKEYEFFIIDNVMLLKSEY